MTQRPLHRPVRSLELVAPVGNIYVDSRALSGTSDVPGGRDSHCARGSEAFLNWTDYLGLPHPRAEVALDLDGDGRQEWGWVRQGPGEYTTAIRIGGRLELHSAAGAGAETVRVGDLDRNGAVDVIIGAPGVGAATLIRMPAPGRWGQRLVDAVAPRTPLPPGTTRSSVRQSTHRVDELAVVSRIEGASPGDLTFVLRSPGGQCIALPAPEPVEGIIRLHADASNVDLSPMLGWQPHGEWRLEIENSGRDTPALVSFSVMTGGAFVAPIQGSRQSAPKPLRLVNGALGRALVDTTLGGIDTVALSCGDTHDAAGLAPERWFEFKVAQRRTVAFQLAADFRAGLELRGGPCAQAGPALDCLHLLRRRRR